MVGKHLYAGDWSGEETAAAVINFSAARYQKELDTYMIGWVIARQDKTQGANRPQGDEGTPGTDSERVTADMRTAENDAEEAAAELLISELRRDNNIRKAGGDIQRIWEEHGGQFNENLLDGMNAAEAAFRGIHLPTINARERFDHAATRLRKALCGTPPDHDDAVPALVDNAPDVKFEFPEPRLWAAPNAAAFIRDVIEARGRSLETTLGTRDIRGHVFVHHDGLLARLDHETEARTTATTENEEVETIEDKRPVEPAAEEGTSAFISDEQVEADPYRTGLPGRPSKLKHLIEQEFQRRAEAGEACLDLADEAAELRKWAVKAHPAAPPPTEKTIKNNLRNCHRQYRSKPTPEISAQN